MEASMDVWIVGLGNPGDGVDPVDGLRRVFGLSEQVAGEIGRALPRVVKRRVDAHTAFRIADALTRIGWEAEVHRSRPAIELAPGARPAEPSMRVAAAHPVSLPPLKSSTPPPKAESSSLDSVRVDLEGIDAFTRGEPPHAMNWIGGWSVVAVLTGLAVVAYKVIGD